MPPSDATQLYLNLLTKHAPRGTLLDIRYRIDDGNALTQFFLSTQDPSAATTLVRIGQHTDVYVGCAPRLRRSGTRQDIAPATLLWADCDGPAAATLHAFPTPPSMIVASGSGSNAHAYWALTNPIAIDELEHANLRLAITLNADLKCADAARILRPPGTLNFKHEPPSPVQLREHTNKRYHPSEILKDLPPLPAHLRRGSTGRRLLVDRSHDPLHKIKPATYVQRLTGRTPDSTGKICCPLHKEEAPSFHIYRTPERGWTCYGCPTTNGRPIGGDIYTLASLLWNIPTQGRAFLDLRARLDDLFGIDRSQEQSAHARLTPPSERKSLELP
jgi:hypothetical protein